MIRSTRTHTRPTYEYLHQSIDKRDTNNKQKVMMEHCLFLTLLLY